MSNINRKPSLWRNEQGVALAEFALALPILFLLFGATIEITRLLISYQQVDKSGNQLADIVTQAGGATCAELEDLVLVMPQLIDNYDASNGKVVFTVASRAGTDPALIDDQYETGALGNASRIGVVGAAPDFGGAFALLADETVLVVEVFHNYQPVLGSFVEFLGVNLPDGDSAEDVLYKRSIYVSRVGGLSEFGGC